MISPLLEILKISIGMEEDLVKIIGIEKPIHLLGSTLKQLMNNIILMQGLRRVVIILK